MNTPVHGESDDANEQCRSTADPVLEALFRESEILNADCRFEAADALILASMRDRPLEAKLAEQLTDLALQRGDWRTARQRANSLRSDFPDEQAGYRLGFIAEMELLHLGKAVELQRDAASRFPQESWPLTFAAILAELRQNYTAAERLRKEVCDRFPSDSSSWKEWATLCLRAGRLEAAERILSEALSLFPDDVSIYVTHAELAVKSGRTEFIEERWRAAAERFPEDPVVVQHFAEAPVEFRKDKQWDVARSRYEQLNRSFPDFAYGFTRHVMLLARAGNIDEAEALARQSQARFRDSGQHSEVVVELARILHERGAVDDATALLYEHLKEVPNAMSAYVMLSSLLGRQARFDDADTICRRAISRFKFKAAPRIAYAKVASLKGDTHEALDRWKRALHFVPRDPTIGRELFIARIALIERQAANAETDALLSIESERRSGPLTNLMLQFESLGGPGAGGCEFGIVQRNFGAEPIGLLRWASLSTDHLILGLDQRFEGLGGAEQTEVRLPSLQSSGAQYSVVDTRFKIAMHTWVMRGDMEAEALQQQWCGRLKFLRRKLISDLELGTKIFLYRPGRLLTEVQIERLGSAVRGYGDNKLLLIQVADSSNRHGTVRWVSPGVMVGYIDRLNWEEGRPNLQPSYASWARICTNAQVLCAEKNG